MQYQHVTRVHRKRPEKVVRDIVRLEIAALLHLVRTGKATFMQDVIAKANDPLKVTWIYDELGKIEMMLREKVAAEDDA